MLEKSIMNISKICPLRIFFYIAKRLFLKDHEYARLRNKQNKKSYFTKNTKKRICISNNVHRKLCVLLNLKQ